MAAAAIAAAVWLFTAPDRRVDGEPATLEPRIVTTSKAARQPNAAAPVPAQATARSKDPTDPLPVMPPTPADPETILAQIHEAAITYDAGALPSISPHLSSPDPAVRAAALAGIVLLGDAAGAPLLRRAADRARHPAEAAELRAQADYLELPTARLLSPEKIEEIRARHAAAPARFSRPGSIGQTRRPPPRLPSASPVP